MNHQLKTCPKYFQSVWDCLKTFEVRKNDRAFLPGDTISLDEYDPGVNCYSGRSIDIVVTYVLLGGQLGIENGYCCLGFKIMGYNESLD